MSKLSQQELDDINNIVESLTVDPIKYKSFIGMINDIVTTKKEIDKINEEAKDKVKNHKEHVKDVIKDIQDKFGINKKFTNSFIKLSISEIELEQQQFDILSKIVDSYIGDEE